MQDRINMAELAALVAALVNSGGGGGGVTDVQVNGVSVVTDGVANVPIASSSDHGVVAVNASAGIDINSDTGKLRIASANGSEVRFGNDVYRPIVPSNEHTAAFYGLAKAAGDTTQKNIAFDGVYTDSAKDKIQQMLGIIEMIAPHEEAQASQAYSIGDAFVFAGKLYRATSAIAIDDAIAPGTNCTQTTLIQLIGGN